MTKKITYLVEVTEAVEGWVTRHGAYFDKAANRWAVEDGVPPELESFVEKAKRVRDYIAERTPQCEICGCQMLLRTSIHGEFWSCSAFPRCKGKRAVAADDYNMRMIGEDLSYAEVNAVEVENAQDEPIFLKENIAEKTAMQAPDPAEGTNEQLNTMGCAQDIYDRATQLFGSRRAAVSWLTSVKVGLGHQTPIDAMRTTKGCELVEKLLKERFESNG